MEINNSLKPRGDVEGIIEYNSGKKVLIAFPNTVVKWGREALAASLANDLPDGFNYYVNRMIFGNAGTSSGVPKFVDANTRNGLFCGDPIVNRPVISAVDPDIPSQVVFTSIITYTGASIILNEMALQLANGNLYSMVTFPDLTLTEDMQITWNWRLSFV